MKKGNTKFDIMKKAQDKFNSNEPCNIELKNGTIVNALNIKKIDMDLNGGSISGFIVCLTKERELRYITFDVINDIT